jgi:hypothetical protein
MGFLEHGAEKNLLQLHEFGVFTTDGQGNDCNPIVSIFDGEEKEYKEKPYLNGFFHFYDEAYTRKIIQLLEKLSNDPRIFMTFYDGKHNVFFDNFQYEYMIGQGRRPIYTLTFEDGHSFTTRRKPLDKEMYIRELYQFELGSMPFMQRNNMMEKCVSFQIVVKEFCSKVLADQILLEHMIDLNFEKKVKDEFYNPSTQEDSLEPSGGGGGGMPMAPPPGAFPASPGMYAGGGGGGMPMAPPPGAFPAPPGMYA